MGRKSKKSSKDALATPHNASISQKPPSYGAEMISKLDERLSSEYSVSYSLTCDANGNVVIFSKTDKSDKKTDPRSESIQVTIKD